MAKRDPTAEILNDLRRIERDPAAPDAESVLRRALASPINVVVARAATNIGNTQVDLAPDLNAAFERFMADPEKDQACQAKEQIVLALSRMGIGDDVHMQAIYHVQMEYGEIETTSGVCLPFDGAADMRAMAIVALAQNEHPQAQEEAVRLLTDAYESTRRGAAQALAAGSNYDGALVLRYKALEGEREPTVQAEIFKGLLAIDPRGLQLVTRFVLEAEIDVAVIAALALGETGRLDALAPLIQAWQERRSEHPDASDNLLLAIATLRQDEGIEFLLSILRDGDEIYAMQTLTALRPYRSDMSVAGRIRTSAADSDNERIIDQAEAMFPQL